MFAQAVALIGFNCILIWMRLHMHMYFSRTGGAGKVYSVFPFAICRLSAYFFPHIWPLFFFFKSWPALGSFAACSADFTSYDGPKFLLCCNCRYSGTECLLDPFNKFVNLQLGVSCGRIRARVFRGLSLSTIESSTPKTRPSETFDWKCINTRPAHLLTKQHRLKRLNWVCT